MCPIPPLPGLPEDDCTEYVIARRVAQSGMAHAPGHGPDRQCLLATHWPDLGPHSGLPESEEQSRKPVQFSGEMGGDRKPGILAAFALASLGVMESHPAEFQLRRQGKTSSG